MKAKMQGRLARKALAALLAAMMATAAFAMPAFAVDWPTPAYDSVQGDTGESAAIPVYGYVGEDGEIDDDDPDDPNNPPTVTPYEVNVSVPVKVMWAAFESDAGVISAPTYHITNNSQATDLTVTVVSFTPGSTGDNTNVDSTLKLNLTGDELATSNLMNDGTALSGGSTKITDFDAQEEWEFSFGGTWGGASPTWPSTAYSPTYTMTFLFETV